MTMNEEDRNYVLNEFLEIIADISDKEYQRRIWVRGEELWGHDFDETVCQFFDREFVLNNYKDYHITESQYYTLMNFYNVFNAFCSGSGEQHHLPEVFIDTPEWTRITEMAKEVLTAFNYKSGQV
jgi:hypothetical protein